MNWHDPKPSSQPAITDDALGRLPPGMVVLSSGRPMMVTGFDPLRGRLWHAGHRTWGDDLQAMIVGDINLPKLPRLSCAVTTSQVRQRSKDCSRRVWEAGKPSWAEPGRVVLLVDKMRQAGVQGLAVVRLETVRQVQLDKITAADVVREGFAGGVPGFDLPPPDRGRAAPRGPDVPSSFVRMFCELNSITPGSKVWRITWSYHWPALPWQPGFAVPIGFILVYEPGGELAIRRIASGSRTLGGLRPVIYPGEQMHGHKPADRGSDGDYDLVPFITKP